MAPSVDVIVPVRDRWELTESCLEHLRRQTLAHTVIVCDNGSTDRTPERLRELFPEVRIVDVGTNSGFSVACNLGVHAGTGDIVVLLNNDVDCGPEFLECLVAPFDHADRLGSVAALLVKPGGERIESFGLTADPTLAGFPRLRGLSVRRANSERPILVGPSGAAGAYRRRAWEEVHGLDEGVFFYGEDVDLALRLRQAGWSTTASITAVAVHVGSASAENQSSWQRFQGGFARGYFLRRYGVLRRRVGVRAFVTEAIVVLADALIFSHDLAAARGRIAGWRAARGRPRSLSSSRALIDHGISFVQSLKLRLGVFTGREPRS